MYGSGKYTCILAETHTRHAEKAGNVNGVIRTISVSFTSPLQALTWENMAFGGSRAPSLLEELEQEMKLLHWHKLANEAALKAALIRSKRLKARDNKVILQEAKQQERAVWIQKVLEEEQQKPLEVTDDFIRGYEAREQRNQEKLAQEVAFV
jgi:hypothetical protein